jgi:oxalate decarboxylase/phosphoglucose isomerase-like protein (cupin superfamily)
MSARLIRFPTVHDSSGNLTPFEWRDIPFTPRRVFVLHDVVEGARRGGHAHHTLEELIVAVSGSFDVVTLDEHGHHRWHLSRADSGLYIPPDVWRHLCGFSGNAVALVLASTAYDPLDYIRDMSLFLASLPSVEGDFYLTPDYIAEAVATHGKG